MNHIKRNSLFLAALLALPVLFLAGCEKMAGHTVMDLGTGKELKTLTSSSGGSLADYQTFLNTISNGNFGIKSYATTAHQTLSRTVYAGGAFTDANMNTIAGGPLSIGGITTYDSLAGTDYSYGNNYNVGTSKYGTTVLFNINPNTSGVVNGACSQTSLYVPTLINMNYPVMDSAVKVGSAVTWNADPSNTKNVLITLEYQPDFAPNLPYDSLYPNQMVNAVTVPDNGSYIFQTADLAGFPPSCMLNLKLIRLNYAFAYSTDSTRKYQISAYNCVDGVFPRK